AAGRQPRRGELRPGRAGPRGVQSGLVQPAPAGAESALTAADRPQAPPGPGRWGREAPSPPPSWKPSVLDTLTTGALRMRPLPPAPPASTEELLQTLLRTRLLDAPQAERLAGAWPPDGPPAERTDQLVAAGLLTAHQAAEVLAGRADALRLG